ncbi:serine hydrolase [Candidatus Uabimicrobium sp. HlEnr_7]|uniref:serine hydrolase n=1 Tax=Candidatus Uabimicrobium helgolandensis TaxID=3095367 RepID=UPI0035583D5E
MYQKLIVCFFIIQSLALAQNTLQQEIDKMINPIIKNEWNVGVAIGIYQKDKKNIVLTYGVKNKDSQQKITEKTIFETGSISKAFTGMLLSKMILDKKLSLANTVGDFIKFENEIAKITLEQLVTHTSGLPRMPTNIVVKNQESPYADYTYKEMLSFLRKHKLSRKPGIKYEYSNLGMSLLGKILETVAKKSYEELLVQEICKPLQMNNTKINFNENIQLATGYDPDFKPALNWDFPAMNAAGAVRSNIDDSLLLIEKTLKAYDTENKSTLQQAILNSHNTLFEIDKRLKIAMAWHIIDDITWHNGGTEGFRSFLGFDSKRSIGVVVFTNTRNSLDYVGQNILRFLSGKDIRSISLPKIIDVDQKTLLKYVGTYQLGLAQINITLENNKLIAQMSAQPAFRIYPESETMFFWKVVNAKAEFVKDNKGKIERLILHQYGQKMPALKIK